MPTLNLLTPRERNAASDSWVTVPGLVSIVISAPEAMRKVARRQVRTASICCGARSDGVPPPKKIVSYDAEPNCSLRRRISRLSAARKSSTDSVFATE